MFLQGLSHPHIPPISQTMAAYLAANPSPPDPASHRTSMVTYTYDDAHDQSVTVERRMLRFGAVVMGIFGAFCLLMAARGFA